MNLDELIDQRLADADDLVPVLLFNEIAAAHPDAIDKFLIDHAPTIVCDHIRRRLATQRAAARKRLKVETFEHAVAEMPTDGGAALRRFTGLLAVRQSVEDGSQRVYGECDRLDVLFVADTYDTNGKRNLMLAAFHRQVAMRLTEGQRVADVFRPGDLEAMLEALGP